MKRKILLIDDETFLLRVLLVRLKHWGYDSIGAENGKEGLAIMRKNKPDLIILDKEMPGMNGEEVVRIVKGDPELKQIPIIMISADVENIDACAKRCGIAQYLTKPCEPEDLLAMIQMELSPSENVNTVA
jgi:two-component system, OmpR family, alkaline phosphatase synthesis response regulator PhoP